MSRRHFNCKLEEFFEHTIAGPNSSRFILKDEALDMLGSVFEEFPFLEEAIDKSNKYRINVSATVLEMFLIPAMRYVGVIEKEETKNETI